MQCSYEMLQTLLLGNTTGPILMLNVVDADLLAKLLDSIFYTTPECFTWW